MSAKHTPGPWHYAQEYGPNTTELPRITTVARCANFVIGLPSDVPGGNYRDGDPSGDEEADARLIAAAPELLDALQSFLRAPSVGSNGPGSITITVQDFNLRAARDAIAKATGSAPCPAL